MLIEAGITLTLYLLLILLSKPSIASENCLIYSSDLSCLSCLYGFYLESDQSSPAYLKCLEKIGALNDTFYVGSSDGCTMNCNGSFEDPFPNLVFALEAIVNLTKKIYAAEARIFFIGKEHFILERDLAQKQTLLLRRENIRIHLAPYACYEININYGNCLAPEEKAIIFIKTYNFFIYIAQELIISNIIWNGCYLGQLENACPDRREKCETTFDPRNYILIRNQSNSFSYTTGVSIFKIEGFIELSNSSAELTIINSQFKNFYNLIQPEGYRAIISLYDLGGHLSLNNVSVESCYFTNGIAFQLRTVYDPIYKNIETQVEIRITTIYVNNTNISAYNDIKARYEPPESTSLFSFIERSQMNINYFKIENTASPNLLIIFYLEKAQIQAEAVSVLNCVNVSLIVLNNLESSFLLRGITIQSLYCKYEFFIVLNNIESASVLHWLSSDSVSRFLFFQMGGKSFFQDFLMRNQTGGFFLGDNVIGSFADLDFFNSRSESALISLSLSNLSLDNTSFRNIYLINQNSQALILFNDSNLLSILSITSATFSAIKGYPIIFDLYSNKTLAINCSFLNLSLDYIWSRESTVREISLLGCFFFEIDVLSILWHTSHLLERFLIDSNRFEKVSTWLYLIIHVTFLGQTNVSRNIFHDVGMGSFRGLLRFDSLRLLEFGENSLLNCGFQDQDYSFYTNKVVFQSFDCLYVTIANNTFIYKKELNLAGGVLKVEYSDTVVINNCSFLNTIHGTPKIAIRSNFVLKLNLKNIWVSNFSCINAESSFFLVSGVVLISNSRDFSDNPVNDYQSEFKNISFWNCSCKYGGALSIINYNLSSLSDIKAFLSQSDNYGGSIFLAFDNYVVLNKIIIVGSKSGKSGGALKTELSNEILLSDSLFIECMSALGGVFFFKESLSTLFLNITVDISTAISLGGMICLQYSTLLIKSSKFSGASASLKGAFIYAVAPITLYFLNISLSKMASLEGGCIWVVDCFNFTMENSTVDSSKSDSLAAVIFLSNVVETYIKTLKIAKAEGNAVGSVYILNDRKISTSYLFQDLSCLNSLIKIGSCIYFYSYVKSILYLSSTIIGNSTGVAVNIYCMQTMKVFVNSLLIDTHIAEQEIISVFNSEMEIINFALMNSSITSSTFLIRQSLVHISNFSRFKTLNDAITKFIFSFQNSKIYMVALNLANLRSTSLFQSSSGSTYLISDCTFENISHSLIPFISMASSNMSIINSIFHQISGLECVLILSLEAGEFVIKDSKFLKNQYQFRANPDQNSILDEIVNLRVQNKNGSINIINSLFETFSGIDINIVSSNDVLVFKTTFSTVIENSAKKLTRALLLSNFLNLTLKNNIFLNKQHYTGSCILIQLAQNQNINQTSVSTTIEIEGNLFSGSVSQFGSVFFINVIAQITVIQNQFCENKATLIPGMIYSGIAAVGIIDCLLSCEVIVKRNQFVRNIAERLIPTIFSKSFIELEENIYLENVQEGNISSSGLYYYPIYFQMPFTLRDYNNLSIAAVSGVPFTLSIIISSSNNNTLKYDNQSTALIVSEQDQPIVIEKGFARSEEGVFKFDNIVLKTNASFIRLLLVTQIAHLEFSNNSRSSGQEVTTIDFFFRKCQIGEIKKQDYTCFRCEEGSYSLRDPYETNYYFQSCLKCPVNADCPGGAEVIPHKGYWRFNNRSILIHRCLNEEACPRNNKTYNFNESCNSVYEGNLCFYCAKGYARVNEGGRCVSCAENIWSYFKFVGFLLFLLGLITFQVKYYLILNKHDESFVGLMIRMILNFFQQISMISIVDLGWSYDIKLYFNFQNYFSFLTDDLFSNECLLEKIGYNMLLLKAIYSNILPLILLVSLMLLFYGFKMIRNTKELIKYNEIKDELKVTTIIVIYILYPEIIKKCLSLTSCMLIDENSKTRVLTNSPDIVCGNAQHTLWVLIISVPGLFIWGVFSPSMFLYLLIKNKHKIRNNLGNFSSYRKHIMDNSLLNKTGQSSVPSSEKLLSLKSLTSPNSNPNKRDLAELLLFLYRGYKPDKYYWEFLVFMKKFILIFIGVFTEIFSKESKSVMLLILLISYLFITYKSRPYINKRLNELEILSYLTLFLISIVGVLLFSPQIKPYSIYLFTFIVFISSLFVLMWLVNFYRFLRIKQREGRFKSLFSMLWAIFTGRSLGLNEEKSNSKIVKIAKK